MTTKLNAISSKLADLFTKAARADAQVMRAGERLINELVILDKQPTWFLAPSNELSTSTPEEYAACQLAYASGLGNVVEKNVTVKSYSELFLVDIDALKEREKELKALIKEAKTDSVKRTLSKESQAIAATKQARNTLLTKLSSMMRDNARKLITAYAKQAQQAALQMGKTSKEAKEAYKAKKDELDAASGFTKKKSPAEKTTGKTSLEVIKQQAKNLKNAIDTADESPLIPRELEQLFKLLTKIDTCEQH